MTRSPESLLNRNNSLQSACSYITLLVLMAGLLVLLIPAMASGGPVPVQQATIVIPVAGAALAAAFIVRITRTSPDERVQKISLYSIQYGAMTSFFIAGLLLLYQDTGNSIRYDAECIVCVTVFSFIASTLVFLLYFNRRGDVA